MGKLSSAVVTAIFLILTTIGVLLQIDILQQQVAAYVNNQFLTLLGAFGFIALFGIFYIVILVMSIRGIDLLSQKIRRKDLTITCLNESEPFLGGTLLLQVRHTGVLLNGYFHIRVRSPFNEEYVLRQYYDESTKKGIVNDYLKDHEFNCKIDIPKNFTIGDFKINVEMRDVITWFGMRKDYRCKINSLTIPITKFEPKYSFSIHKVTNPKLKKLNNIERLADTISGWVCIKLQNPHNYDLHDCFGFIKTDVGKFPIYDYELFVKNEEKPNLDDYSNFSLTHQLTKRLYSNITAIKPTGMIHVELDNDEINDEFQFITSS